MIEGIFVFIVIFGPIIFFLVRDGLKKKTGKTIPDWKADLFLPPEVVEKRNLERRIESLEKTVKNLEKKTSFGEEGSKFGEEK